MYTYVYVYTVQPAAPDHDRSAHALARTISAGNECTKTGDEMALKSGRAKPDRPDRLLRP